MKKNKNNKSFMDVEIIKMKGENRAYDTKVNLL